MKHVVLVEPHWHGHQGTYLRLYAQTLLEQGHRVTALCPYPEEVTAWVAATRPTLAACFKAAAFSRPSEVPAGTRWPELAFTVKFWKETARAVAAHVSDRPDLVFLSWLDTYVHPHLPGFAIDRIFRYPWSGLYFFPGEHRGTSRYHGASRALLKSGMPFRSRHCCGIGVLDEATQAPLARALAPRPVVVLPDLTDEAPPTGSELSNAVLRAAAGRRVIACVGSLARRKGVHELIRVCEQSAGRPWFFVFAGKLDTVDFSSREIRDILRFLQHPPANAFVHRKVVPDGNEFNSLVAASDLLYLHYLNFPHSSNLLTKATLLRRPVLVSDRHLMAERVARHRLGLAVREGDVEAITHGIARILEKPAGQGHDFSSYLSHHAASQLASPLARLVDEASHRFQESHRRWTTSSSEPLHLENSSAHL
jgi:glycosyltransferase involved in cell wall biosynthesis